MYRTHVLVCGGTGCTSGGCDKVIAALEGEIKKAGLDQEVCVVKTGCSRPVLSGSCDDCLSR